MRPCAIRKQLIVEHVKVFLRLFLVREYLDNLLPLHHFFHKAFYVGKRALLRHHVFCAIAANLLYNEGHRNRTKPYNKEEPYAIYKHQYNGRDERERATQKSGQALSDELTGCIRVVGVRAHDIPVRMRIEVLDRQFLHLCEHIRTQMVEGALRNRCHNPRIQERGQDDQGVDGNHHNDKPDKLALQRFRKPYLQPRRRVDSKSRQQYVANQSFHVHGRNQTAYRAKCKEDKRNDSTGLVILKYRLNQTAKRTFFDSALGYGHTPTAHRALGHHGRFAHSPSRHCGGYRGFYVLLRHYASPPSCDFEAFLLVCAS